MPNRGRTRLRGAALLFLAFGALGCFFPSLYACYRNFTPAIAGPVAQGVVTTAEVKSYTGPSSRDHVTHYFVEYEVRFAVPAEQCLTGTTFVNDGSPRLVWEWCARAH